MRNCIAYPSGFRRKGYVRVDPFDFVDTAQAAYPNSSSVDELCLGLSRGIDLLGIILDDRGTYLGAVISNTTYENDGIVTTNQNYYEIIPENQTVWHRTFFSYKKSQRLPLSFLFDLKDYSEVHAKQICDQMPTCLGYQVETNMVSLVGTNAKFNPKTVIPISQSTYYEKETEHYIINLLLNNEYAIYMYISGIILTILTIMIFNASDKQPRYKKL